MILNLFPYNTWVKVYIYIYFFFKHILITTKKGYLLSAGILALILRQSLFASTLFVNWLISDMFVTKFLYLTCSNYIFARISFSLCILLLCCTKNTFKPVLRLKILISMFLRWLFVAEICVKWGGRYLIFPIPIEKQLINYFRWLKLVKQTVKEKLLKGNTLFIGKFPKPRSRLPVLRYIFICNLIAKN